MINLKLERKFYNHLQTIGVMEVWRDNLFVCCFATLEPDWQNNKTEESCIPKGSYVVKPYSSSKYPNVLEITDVKGRSVILIHAGNYYNPRFFCLLKNAF